MKSVRTTFVGQLQAYHQDKKNAQQVHDATIERIRLLYLQIKKKILF